MNNALLVFGAAAAIGALSVFGAGNAMAEQTAPKPTAGMQLAQNDAAPSDEAAEADAAATENAATDEAATEDSAADEAATGEAAQAAEEGAPEKSLEEKGYVLGDVVIGDENAPVTIIEYVSLTCPHCAHFNNDTLPALQEKYIDTGKAKLIVREVYFDQFGLWATAVARCGGEMRYHAFIDTFFKQQKEWTRGESQDAIVDKIRAIGRMGGLSPQRVDACLSDEAYVTELVETFQKYAKEDDVRSTPMFLINGEVVRGARSVEEMSAVIDGQLAD